MAGSRSDAVARAFGGRVVIDPDARGPASHDGRGARFVFLPADGAAYALDVEPRGPVPEALAAAGITLEAWTEVEVVAKLTGTPAHLVLRAQDRPEGVEIARADTATHLIAVGRRR